MTTESNTKQPALINGTRYWRKGEEAFTKYYATHGEEYPSYGIVLKDSELCVVDLDKPSLAPDWLIELLEDTCEFIVLTSPEVSDGALTNLMKRHFYYADPLQISQYLGGGLCTDAGIKYLDFKGAHGEKGGYVIGPGSWRIFRDPGSGSLILYQQSVLKSPEKDQKLSELPDYFVQIALENQEKLIKSTAEVPASTESTTTVAGLEDADDPEDKDLRQRRLNGYAKTAIERHLKSVSATHGVRGERDNTFFKACCRLIELANSYWNDYTLADVQGQLFAVAPYGKIDGDAWTRKDALRIWRSASRAGHAGGKTVMEPYFPEEIEIGDLNLEDYEIEIGDLNLEEIEIGDLNLEDIEIDLGTHMKEKRDE